MLGALVILALFLPTGGFGDVGGAGAYAFAKQLVAATGAGRLDNNIIAGFTLDLLRDLCREWVDRR